MYMLRQFVQQAVGLQPRRVMWQSGMQGAVVREAIVQAGVGSFAYMAMYQACAADQSGQFFVRKFWPIFGSRWPLFGPPWPSPGPPGLRSNSLDLRESGLDPVGTKFRPKNVSRVMKNQKSHV